jgi:hypothetical protein
MDTVKITADAMTRASQIAAGELKQLARDQGAKFHENRISDRAKAIGDHIRDNPRILRARGTPDFWAQLHR